MRPLLNSMIPITQTKKIGSSCRVEHEVQGADGKSCLSGRRKGGQDHIGPKGDKRRGARLLEKIMRKEYDLSKMEGRKNLYADDLKAQVSISLEKAR